jgi:hypothetical protein
MITMTPTAILPLKVDLRGRVRNMRLAPSNALFALYEAVVNSIHAILDGPEPQKGRIAIRILRDQMTLGGKSDPGPVTGFEIHDNGIGFEPENFEAFSYSDSTTKARYGGKGVGRLLWLKVFGRAKITSVFSQGQKRFKREFTFSLDGISSSDFTETPEPRGTTVTIKVPLKEFHSALQHEPETIAISIIEHCLEYFIADKNPQVFLSDEGADYEAELGQLFQNDLKSEIKRDDFQISGNSFRITHLLVRGRRNSRHAMHFCAHFRRVKDEVLSGKIPGLSGGLRPAGSVEDLAYQGYVSGDLLNQLVDVERASFDFDLFGFGPQQTPNGSVSFETLLEVATNKTKKFLEPILQPILEENQTRIRDKIETVYPQYRHLLKHRPEEVAAIVPGTEGKDLDIALYRIEQKLDLEGRALLSKELAEAKDPNEPAAERKARLDRLLEQLNDSGIAKLARHVTYRRAVIEFLEDQITLQSNGKYSLEEALHSAVCPTRCSSDEVSSANMNLWLLDDRLYFHYYLASDMPFKDMKETVTQQSEDRPDLAIFHRPMAFSDSLDQIGAVVLVEFKRPVRDDFKMDDPEKNPVSQVLKYVTTLTSGNARRSKGQAIHIRENTPFYAYIIGDFTKSLREIATREDFTPTPDGEGFFRFYRNYNCYVEMISFQKMIRDAKKRNQAFFDKLNIPMH